MLSAKMAAIFSWPQYVKLMAWYWLQTLPEPVISTIYVVIWHQLAMIPLSEIILALGSAIERHHHNITIIIVLH